MAIVFALLAALAYGAGDFFGGLASKRTATIAVVIWSQSVGTVVVGIAIAFLGGRPDQSDLSWGAASALAGAAAVLLLYRGLSIGTMGVVSPITAVFAAVVPVIYGVIFRNEHPGTLAICGIFAAVVAVVCVSATPGAAAPSENKQGLLPPGLIEAFVAGMLFGALFIALAQIRSEAGLIPLLVARIVSVSLLCAFALRGRTSLRLVRSAVPAIVTCGVLDMGANVLYLLAIQRGSIAIVAVLTSLYPTATVGIAGVVLGERLGTLQWAGVAMALFGVVAISAS